MTWDSWHGPMTLGHALVDVIELGMMAAAVWIWWRLRQKRRRRRPEPDTVALTAERRTMILNAERRERGDRDT